MILKDLRINTRADTEKFAVTFAKEVKGGMTIGLSGELGAGKTTLMRFLLTALGSPDQVSSPTYVLQNVYRMPDGAMLIEHWDVYRLSQAPEELLDPPDKNTVRIIEWPERFAELMTTLDVLVQISLPEHLVTAESREIQVRKLTSR